MAGHSDLGLGAGSESHGQGQCYGLSTAVASTTTAATPARTSSPSAILEPNTTNGNNNSTGTSKNHHDHDAATTAANVSAAPPLSLHSHRQSHSSSKLPAFRFADLKPGTTTSLAHPLFSHFGPPTPVSPVSPAAPEESRQPAEPPAAHDLQTTTTITHGGARESPAASTSGSARGTPQSQNPRTSPAAALQSTPVPATASETTSTPPPAAAAATSIAKTTTTAPTAVAAAPESFPLPRSPDPNAESPADSLTQRLPSPPPADLASASSRFRRAPPPSRSFSASSTPAGSSPASAIRRQSTFDSAIGLLPSPDKSSLDSPSGQRELILPKTLSQSSNPDERRASLHRSPPVSYKPPISATTSQPNNATPVRVPPIRAFRSSGSRKSIGFDMNLNFNSTRPYDPVDDNPDLNHDRTLRALEGRFEPDSSPQQMSPSASTKPSMSRRSTLNDDDTGDVFLKIAREESSTRQPADATSSGDILNSASRFRTSSHKRPLSTAVASYHPTSPPQLSRRLSDQQESSRPRKYEDDRASDVSRITTYRSIAREKVASIFPGEDLIRSRPVGSALRPSPLSPRTDSAQEVTSDQQQTPHRRRTSTTDANSTITPRNSSYRPMGAGHAHARSHGSSPLVKSVDFQGRLNPETPHGVEGTESSNSTAAPSTVWDELDDLKSRIHRLELTGKLPATSGAAMSRLSDERPPTATTTVTTVSSSPKRSGAGAGTGAAAQSVEAASTTSSHREAHHPLLQSALAKTKVFLNPEVYRALESAANDAMALSSMMGSPGQPGPISSGASNIGTGATVTDRQLRRKADSVCRSLTELCVALGEDVSHQAKPTPAAATPQATHTHAQTESPSTPVAAKALSIVTSQRRQSIAEPDGIKSVVSPRAMSKFEERRNSILSGNTLPSPRVINSIPSTPNDTTPNRRSSLLVARSRRAGTEEPEDGRKSILRTRRAGTEEPDEGRKTSLLVRHRRGTMGDDEDPRPMSRAIETNGIRHVTREYQPQHQTYESPQQSGGDAVTQVSTTVPRRRFVSSTLHSSRLATPSVPSLAAPKRYLERSAPAERDGGAVSSQVVEERPVRHTSLGQSMMLDRTGSLSTRRQNRDSTYSATSTTATTGAYR